MGWFYTGSKGSQEGLQSAKVFMLFAVEGSGFLGQRCRAPGLTFATCYRRHQDLLVFCHCRMFSLTCYSSAVRLVILLFHHHHHHLMNIFY